MGILNFINYFLLLILIAINIKIIYGILSNKVSSLHPYSIFVLTVTFQMFPQLFTIFSHNYYSKELIPQLLITMITCQLAFKIGYDKAIKKRIPCRILDITKYGNKPILIIFTIIGMIPLLYYNNMSTVYGGINVVLGLFRSFGMISLILSLIYIKRNKHISLIFLYSIIILSAFPLFYYGLFVKGSRQTLFMLAYIFLLVLSEIYKDFKKQISISFFFIFCFGVFLSASITDLRNKNIYNKENVNIELWEKYKNSLINHNPTNGMDLGNGAILINHTFNNNTYDLGFSIWNGLIQNFIPERIIGNSAKKKLKITIFEDVRDKEFRNNILKGVTTTTGYYSAYKSFSLLGCLLFYAIGYLLGALRKRSLLSSFYLLAFIFISSVIPTMITHELQYLFGNIEVIIIFIVPFFMFNFTTLVKKKRIYYAKY